VATKVLRDFAQDPFPYLDEAEKKKMTAAHSALLRKFTDLPFDESAKVRWQEAQKTDVDNIGMSQLRKRICKMTWWNCWEIRFRSRFDAGIDPRNSGPDQE